jgi:branched-chain amino acid aminotransferase
MSQVWLDGEFLPEEKALIPATDPAFLQGRGLFETLRAYNGSPFRLSEHIDRLTLSAAHFRIPLARPELEDVVPELCARNGTLDAVIRLTLSAGGHLLVTSKERRPLPDAWRSQGAEVMVAPWRRDSRAPLCGHKTTSYFENALIHDEAVRRGCVDALFVGPKGELLEGAVTNVFLVLEGKLVTPRLNPGVLPGITRWSVMEVEKTREKVLKVKDLWKAEEAFVTNSVIEVVPIQKPPGPVTTRVIEAYKALVATTLTRATVRRPSAT